MRIKAGYLNGFPIRCSVCLDTKEAGRIYDVDNMTIFDPMTGAPARSGSVSICEACRKEFHTADLELEAEEMGTLASVQMNPVHDDEECGRTTWMRPARHMTFKIKG